MAEPRYRSARPPLARAVRWIPSADSHHYVALLLRGSGRSHMTFVHQRALVAAIAHARSTADRCVAGLLFGRLHVVPDDGARYVMVHAVLPVPAEFGEDEPLQPEPWLALHPTGAASALLTVGWYRSRSTVGVRLSKDDEWMHVAHFGAEWQTALIVTAGSGALFAMDRRSARSYCLPFYEVLADGGSRRARRMTCVTWSNYRADETLLPLPAHEWTALATQGTAAVAPRRGSGASWNEVLGLEALSRLLRWRAPFGRAHADAKSAAPAPAPIAPMPIGPASRLTLAPRASSFAMPPIASSIAQRLLALRAIIVPTTRAPSPAASPARASRATPGARAGPCGLHEHAAAPDAGGERSRGDAERAERVPPFVEAARADEFRVAGRFAASVGSATGEVLWVLYHPALGVLLEALTDGRALVDASVHYNVRARDAHTLEAAFPEHRNLAAQTIYVREACADVGGIADVSRRLRQLDGLQQQWSVTPQLFLLTPGEWAHFVDSGDSAGGGIAAVTALSARRIASLPSVVLRQTGLGADLVHERAPDPAMHGAGDGHPSSSRRRSSRDG
ncbi:MAG TPA: hypothetical protein VFY16_08180 [Gemmatimonadaceae bacterium]|nr:hypothetical protein [Gemmatimonadaceae bacterium]